MDTQMRGWQRGLGEDRRHLAARAGATLSGDGPGLALWRGERPNLGLESAALEGT